MEALQWRDVQEDLSISIYIYIYIYACVVPSPPIYLLCYGYALLHVVLLGCRSFVCLCGLPVDRAFEPVERAICLNVMIVSPSRHGHNAEHILSLMF